MNRYFPIAAAIVFLVGGGLYWFTGSSDTTVGPDIGAANAQEAAAVDTSGITEMVLGDADAPITIVEYASYTCPHCARFHADTYNDLKTEYVDTGKVKFIYREVYFDRYGLWGSMVARCGGPEKFFGITDLIYTQQQQWTKGDPATIAGNLRRIGLTAGLEPDQVDACMQDAEKAETLVAWYQQNAAQDEVTSTPSFLINGEKYSNMAIAQFRTILDAQ